MEGWEEWKGFKIAVENGRDDSQGELRVLGNIKVLVENGTWIWSDINVAHCRKCRMSEKVECQIQRQDTGIGVCQEGKQDKGFENYYKRMVEAINHGIFSYQIYECRIKHL